MVAVASAADAAPGITAALRRAVAAKQVPGVVACAANRHGEIFSDAIGLADAAEGIAMRSDSLFFIASMTKAVTTVAILQLIERGKVGLDEPAARYLPRLAAVAVLEGFDPDGGPRLRVPRTTMTVRHLLASTAGFAYPQWNADIKRYIAWADIPDVLSYREQSLELPLVSDPGACWHYGINSEFVGKIVEAVSGERLDRYFRHHIFEPLGMADTGYAAAADQAVRLSKVHVRSDGALTPIALTLSDPPDFYPGGVGLFSTAGDYLKLTRMLLNGGTLAGRRLLAETTVSEMGQNQLAGSPMPPMRTCDSFWSHDVDLLPGDEPQWGLGFLLNTRPTPEGRAPFSLSWAGACNSYYWIDPARGLTGVFMASVVPFCDPHALAAFRAFEASVYAAFG